MIDQKKLVCPNCYHIGMRKEGRDRKGQQRYKCRKCLQTTIYPIWDADLDIVRENVRLSKQKQKAQDNNRIYNKAFREHARIENAIEEYTKELKTLFENNKLRLNYEIPTRGLIGFRSEFLTLTSGTGIINHTFKEYKPCVININRNRKNGALISMSQGRAVSYKQAILDLNEDFNVTVASIIGNEGRANPEMGWSKIIASDNYDYTIFQCLRYLFRDSCVKFIQGNPSELVINVAGQNLLMLHGHGSLRGKLESAVNQIIGRYSLKGIAIDYMIFGHVHSARIGDGYARSSSLVGSNDYAEKALNLSGRASQNCYIFYDDGNRDGIKIDLQNTDGVGYNIDKSLEAYNAKSASKAKEKKTIFEIVI